MDLKVTTTWTGGRAFTAVGDSGYATHLICYLAATMTEDALPMLRPLTLTLTPVATLR